MKKCSYILRVIALCFSTLSLLCTILAICHDNFNLPCPFCREDDDDFEDDFDEFEDWDD